MMPRNPRDGSSARIRAARAILVLWVAVGWPALDAQSSSATVTFADGRATFSPPQGFSPMSAGEVKQFLPHLDPATSAVGNKARTSTVTYRFVPVNLTRPQLDNFRRYLTQTFEEASADLRWIANRLETVGGRDGIRLEFRDTKQLHHISLVGHVDDEHAIMMSYNIPASELARLEPSVRASISSIRIIR